MGGSLALVSVCQSDAFKVFVDFYGALTKRPELCEDWRPLSYLPLVRDLRCPIQIHVGTADAIISAEEVAEFERLLREHGKDYELYTYPGAGHAFHDDTDRRFAPDHAATAQARAFEYLRERL
jgi:carboxymethylenebutenolidase